jgi:uncharacterized membrane protein
MDLLVIAFRILHIAAAILWVGGSTLFFFYIEPTINKLGPDAERFVDEVINKRKLPVFFALASTFTVIGGVALYLRQAGGLRLWLDNGEGIAFTIGGLAGILAWLGGSLLIAPAVQRVAAIGGEIKAAGGPPSAELMGRMHAAQERLRTIGLADLALVYVAVVLMAVARYLV